jgi:hypothetical protein
MRQTRGVSNLSGVTALAFSPKGHVITLAANGGRVTVQDATASEEIGRLQHGAAVQTATLSFDGMKSFTYAGGGDLWLWQARPALVAAHAAPIPEPSAATIAANDAAPGDDAREETREASGRRKGIFRRLIGVFRK